MTSVAVGLSTVTMVAEGSEIGTSNVFEAEVCDESIEVNEAVLPLLAEIEYPLPENNGPKLWFGPRSSTLVCWSGLGGKSSSVPAPLVGGTSQFAAVDQFASPPIPVRRADRQHQPHLEPLKLEHATLRLPDGTTTVLDSVRDNQSPTGSAT